MPKVSIIMPMLNSIKYLRECMDSVVGQTLSDIEIIPVDAGSTDGTLEMLTEYAGRDNRIKIIRSDKKSVGHQYNLGIAAAQGDYIGFVESDDYIVPRMYEILLDYAEKNDADWVKANYSYFMDYPESERLLIPINDKKFCRVNSVFEPRSCPKQYIQEIFMWRGIYSTEFIRKNGIVLNETAGAAFQDTGFILQVFMYASRAMYIDDYLYCYRRDNQGSSSHQSDTILYEINEVEYISDIIKSGSALHETFWNVNYIRAVNRFLSGYERVPPIQKCSAEILDAVARYREYLLREMESDELFWENCDIMPHFNEMVWLREGIESFDTEYRKLDSQKEALLRKMIGRILSYKKVVVFGCGDNGAGIVSLLLRLKRNEIVCLSDNDKSRWHHDFMGIKVVPPKELRVDGQTIVLVANREFFYEIKAQLIELGIFGGQIWICPQIMRFRGTNLLPENDILPSK